MTIEALKQRKKEIKMTLQEISDESGIPKRTLEDIFRGRTKNPRLDTIQAIERALGIDEKKPSDNLSEEEKRLISLISQLTEEEVKELSSFVDYIVSKRS